MNKIFSRFILWFTALSAVFFTSSVFANTASDGSVYTIWHTNNSRVYDASWSVVYCASAGWSSGTVTNVWSSCTSNANASYDSSYWPVRKYDSYYTQRYSVNYSSNVSLGDKFSVACKNASGSWINNQIISNIKLWVIPTVTMYGNYLKINWQNKWDNLFYDRFYLASDCSIITEAVALALPPYTPPWSCATDNIASGGTCSCKVSSTPTGTSWSGSALSWTWGGSGVTSTTTKTSSWLISGQFSSYSIYKVNTEWYKPNDLLWEIFVSAENSHADSIVFSNTGGVVWNNNYVTFTTDNGYIKFYTDGKWLSSWTENNFNSFYVNSSTGAVTSYFKVYYWENNSIDPQKYLWIYQTNQLITLPNELKTRSIKIVPASNTNFYIWGVSLWNVSYVYWNVCTNLTASGALAELASRSTLSGSTNIANVNFCWSAFDVPYIGSALGAMCNFVQPLIKPLVSGYQTTVDMINIVPPSTAPTTFDYYPKFTFSWMTMDITTQTGAIPVYSTWSDVNPLNITTDASSSNMKIWILALISILLYLAVYALHFWIVAGLVWLLLHISRFFTGFLWKHSGTGNIWSLAPFLVYAWVFFTALLSIIASVSFLLPLLQVIRAYALFLIVWLTSFAPWSYALFSGFYIVVFSSIFLVGTFYLIYVLFEKHSRLN